MDIDKDKLERIIEEMEPGFNLGITNEKYQQLHAQLKALIDPVWEPKEYKSSWKIISNGEIRGTRDSSREYRYFGNEWETKELATKARDMNKRNQLILQAKHEMGYGDGLWDIYYNRDKEEWFPGSTIGMNNPELTFETKAQVETIIKMVGLNKDYAS